MTEVADYYSLYQERLESGASHVAWHGRVADDVDRTISTLGYSPANSGEVNIAHGLLTFGHFSGSDKHNDPQCVPWLISPTAPLYKQSGSRHFRVSQEFYDDFCKPSGFTLDSLYGSDCIGTYNVVADGEHLAITRQYNHFFKVPELRAMANGRVVEISRELGMVKFCLQQSYTEWAVIQNGVQTRVAIR